VHRIFVQLKNSLSVYDRQADRYVNMVSAIKILSDSDILQQKNIKVKYNLLNSKSFL